MIDRPSALRRAALVAAMLALAGCSVQPDQRGNLPDPAVLGQIKPGATDKATVTRLLGSPSSVAAFNGDTWYYISQRTKEIAFFKPQLLDQEVVAIDFNKDGTVRDVRHRGMADREIVTPNPEATPAPGRELTVIEQFLGNFGRFSSQGGSRPTSTGR